MEKPNNFISPSHDEKKSFILETINLLSEKTTDNEVVQKLFNSLKDSLMHTAPEVVGLNWTRLFNICKQNLDDGGNPSHQMCLEIYNNRYEQYKKL